MSDPGSKPRLGLKIRTKWLRATGFYLLGQLALFVLIKRIFHASWDELVGPYLAATASVWIFLVLIWRLKAWKKNNPSPKAYALGWALSMALFITMIDGSWAYLGVEIRLIGPSILDDWASWGFAIALTIISAFVLTYQRICDMHKSQ